MLSGNVCLQHKTVDFVNTTTWTELPTPPHSDCHLWPPTWFFRRPKRLKSHCAKTPHSPTDGSLIEAIWRECHEHPPYSPDFASSEFHLFVSLVGFWNVEEIQETVSHTVSIGKGQSSVLNHTFTNNTLSIARTFRLNMEKWVIVLFHMSCTTLKKKLSNKEIFTVYSYFLFYLCITMVCVIINEGAGAPYCCIPSHTREAIYVQT